MNSECMVDDNKLDLGKSRRSFWTLRQCSLHVRYLVETSVVSDQIWTVVRS